jgi:GTP-binding protein Era
VSALKSGTPALLVLNKIDKVDDKRLLLPVMDTYSKLFPFVSVVPVSAAKSEGLDKLIQAIQVALPEGEKIFPDDYLTDQPLRFMAAEIIREAILHNVRDEIPHASAVLVEKWEESPKLIRIEATIHVERPGQKTILIGSGGQMLRKIGTDARVRIEKLVGRKVFLALFVKVQANWREDPSFLDMIDWRSMLGTEPPADDVE